MSSPSPLPPPGDGRLPGSANPAPRPFTLSHTAVIFTSGERVVVRLYDTAIEARTAGESALAAGTADSFGLARMYQVHERAAR